MNKYLKILILNFAFVSILLLFPAQWKIDIRFAFFTDYTSKGESFKLNADEILSKPISFRSYKQKFIDSNYEIKYVNPLSDTDTLNLRQKIEKIVLSYSKNGGSGCGACSSDVVENIKWVKADDGHGCCSDHSQAFIALCILNGIFAREVHNLVHTFNEFYDPIEKRWIWVDSQFCLFAKNEKDELLGINEIHECFQNGNKINWVFFGTEEHLLYKIQNVDAATDLFSKKNFELLLLTKGNNVFEVDYYNKKYKYLPRELRQLVLLISGIQPSYFMFDPFDNRESYYKKIKYGSLLLCLLIMMANFYFLFRK